MRGSKADGSKLRGGTGGPGGMLSATQGAARYCGENRKHSQKLGEQQVGRVCAPGRWHMLQPELRVVHCPRQRRQVHAWLEAGHTFRTSRYCCIAGCRKRHAS